MAGILADGAVGLVPVPALHMLSDFATGEIVKISENGTPSEFYVAKHGYPNDADSNTLLVRRYITRKTAWGALGVATYASSKINDYFINTYYGTVIDANIKQLIPEVGIQYTPGGEGGYSVSILQRRVFALSGTELGLSYQYLNIEGSELEIASALRVAYDEAGNAVEQWTRSPSTYNSNSVFYTTVSGNISIGYVDTSKGYRPAFCLPSNTPVSDDGTITG